MGLKLSCLSSKNKPKKPKHVEYSPKTAQEMDHARRTRKLIYPPLSSIPDEGPKRFLRSDGRPLYESIHLDYELDEDNDKYQDERYQTTSYFGNRFKQYDDGVFSVLSQQPVNHHNVFRL